MVNMNHLLPGITKFRGKASDLDDRIAIDMVPPGIEAFLHEHLHINDNKSFFHNL